MQLKSDFIDYYDHQFDLDGFQFERFSKSGPDRIEIFELLENLDFVTPRHGYVYDLAGDFENHDIEVVVYTDLNSHCGEGKIKTTLAEALIKYPQNYASELIMNKDKSNSGWSHRYLRIGYHGFWLNYVSMNDWRSNCGEVEIEFEGEDPENDDRFDNLSLPMFAIDFVDNGDNLIAIDFNIAPGLKGTGIEEYLTPSQVVDILRAFIENEIAKIGE